MQYDMITPEMELEAAKSNPGGQQLSPAAQALYEREGAERFARHHPRLASFSVAPEQKGN